MCIDALIQDKFYFTREEIIKVLPDNIRYLRAASEHLKKGSHPSGRIQS
jgi:hypothetical protein